MRLYILLRRKNWVMAIVLALIAWSANFEGVQQQAGQALDRGHIKEAEAIYSQYLSTANDQEVGPAKVLLAIAYYKDQEQEKAFETFLDALEITPAALPVKLSEEESILYSQALKIYLDHAGLTPDETAQEIVNKFGATYTKNPTLHHLEYILAVSYANLGRYDLFLTNFTKLTPTILIISWPIKQRLSYISNFLKGPKQKIKEKISANLF